MFDRPKSNAELPTRGERTQDLRSEREGLLIVCTEGWRLMRSFERVAAKLDIADQRRMVAQLGFFGRQIAESLRACGLRIENLEGHLFDPGLAVTALNLDEFVPGEQLTVDKMLEPQVVSLDGSHVVKWGKVLLRRSVAAIPAAACGELKDGSND